MARKVRGKKVFPETIRTWNQDNKWIAAIAVLFVVLCVAYNLATPYRTSATYNAISLPDIGAPDEIAHVNYIHYLLGNKSFPVMQVPADENYEAHQPPLYYLLASPVSAIGSIINEQAEGFLLRLLSTLIGLITLYFIYRTGRVIFPTGLIPIGATAFAAFLPMQIALFSSVTNDTLMEMFFAIAAFKLVRDVYEGWSYSRAVRFGIIIGLALLTKTTGLLLIPTAIVALCLSPNRPGVNKFLKAGYIVFTSLLVASPWLIRNEANYGDPFALGIFKEAFIGTTSRIDIQTMTGLSTMGYFVQWVGWYKLRTFFGAFGYLIPSWPLWMPDWLYRTLGIASGILMVRFVIYLFYERERLVSRAFLLLLTLMMIVGLSFAWFNLTYFQGQARYLTPAMTTIALAYTVGFAWLFPKRWRDMAAITLGTLMLALAVYAYFVLDRGFKLILG